MFFESIRVTSKHNNTIIYFEPNGELSQNLIIGLFNQRHSILYIKKLFTKTASTHD